MLNYLWAGMILAGVIFGAFSGKMQDITNAALDSSKEAVTLCITMIGVMAFWTGIMEIASRAGIIQMASDKMRPLIRFLFPNLPEKHKAVEHICTNFIANFLGLGWAATPAGLKAMEELLPAEDFIRVHRSFIVRKDKIKMVDRRIPEPVRKCGPGRNYRSGDRGHSGEYGCGGSIL